MSHQDTNESTIDPANEVADLKANYDQHFRRGMKLWAIRWTIGFGVIWAVTGYTGDHAWLWIAGIAVASLSLTVNIGMKLSLDRKVREAEQKKAELDRAIREGEFEDE